MTRRNLFLLSAIALATSAGAYGACSLEMGDTGSGGEALGTSDESMPAEMCGGAICAANEACCHETMACYALDCTSCCPGDVAPPPGPRLPPPVTVPPPAGTGLPGVEPGPLAVLCGTDVCERGEACCRGTGRCYPATCTACCPSDFPLPSDPPTVGRDAGIAPRFRRP